jgi:hypothetical protein
MSPRAFVISQLIAAVILLGGMLLVRHSELGMLITLVASFGIGITVFRKLDDRRAQRREAAERR